jgi:hypothetical protein
MDVTLQSIDDSFNTFFSKTDYFRVGCSICILLQDQMLTAPQVRLCTNLQQPEMQFASSNRYSPINLSHYSYTKSACTKTTFSINIQRISAYSVLCDLYRTEPSGANPFMLFFLDSVEQGTDMCEKRFLVELLCSAPYNREVRQIALAI